MSEDGWWTHDSYARALITSETDPTIRRSLALAYGYDAETFAQEESDRGDAFEDRRQAPPGAIT